ncbi:MAG TPA: M28 family peptidase [Baekduia sp.]|nr:M28 family peptidase [Baekduia sp.]
MPLLATISACCALSAGVGAPSGDNAYAFARELALAGSRPAAGIRERNAHRRVASRLRSAGLKVETDVFRVPGRGRSRNIVGIVDTPASCLRVVMAHADTVPPSPGADDNASGVGAIVAIADALGGVAPSCDVWLVATGAEERIYTGQPDHLGAAAVVRRLKRLGRRDDLRWALSIDEVGRGSSFWIRSKARRPSLETALITAGHQAGVHVKWVADGPGGGNSDHRELTLAGLVAAKIGVPNDAHRHTAADRVGRLQQSAFRRALTAVWPVVAR